jgi:prepilin-type N-terminal cleavage/methylation domain-containing protein
MQLFKYNSKGFTLVEVLIALGIMSMASFYFMKSMDNSLKGINYIEDKISYIQVKGLLERYFSDHSVCLNSLVGKTPTEELTGIYGEAGKPLIIKDEERDKIKIVRLVLTNPNSLSATMSGFVKLNLSIARTREGGGPANFPTLKVDIPVFLDNLGKIARCAPYDLNGAQYTLNPAQLYEYISYAGPSDCTDITGNSSVQFFFNSACSRWCQQSCASVSSLTCKSVNAGPVRPIIHHGGGFVSECDPISSPQIVQCTCIN